MWGPEFLTDPHDSQEVQAAARKEEALSQDRDGNDGKPAPRKGPEPIAKPETKGKPKPGANLPGPDQRHPATTRME